MVRYNNIVVARDEGCHERFDRNGIGAHDGSSIARRAWLARRVAEAWHDRSARRDLVLECFADFWGDGEKVPVREGDRSVKALVDNPLQGLG